VTASAATAAGFSRRDRMIFALVAVLSLAALLLRGGGADPVGVFAAAAVAVAGLAYLLGVATEQAGETAGPRAAALLNATFGNLPELVIVLLTIEAGLVDVARASLVGSVLGNVLFVLGFAILAGTLRNGPLRFDARAAGINASMLTLAVIALAVPSLYARTHTHLADDVHLSVAVACVMLVLYVAYLVHAFQRPELTSSSLPGGARWTRGASLCVLAATAIGTGVLSEVLVDAIRPTIADTGLGAPFIGLIIVPIVGNVAEHLAAVRIAWSGQLDFAMGITFNSGLQVSLGVTALAVFAGVLLGHELVLVFPTLELALLAAAALMAGRMAADGEVTWLEGLELLAVYALAALAFWFV
jgi:Ca2+:H+ antiporter